MLQRIEAILKIKALSVTQFADEVGVPRPVMSHIMSGRNKPSLEVVQKILKGFPDISVPWLVLGEGTMLKKEEITPGQVESPSEKKQEEATSDQKFKEVPVQVKSQKDEIERKVMVKHGAGKAESEKIIILYSDNSFREFEKRPE